MRPNSIIWFERLFLPSLAIGTIGSVIQLSSNVARFAANPATAQFGTGFVIFTIVATTAINILFWFFIARRASNVAKWIWVVFLIFGLLSLTMMFVSPIVSVIGAAWKVFALLINGLQIAAAFMLFRPDARAWFAARGKSVDPSVFD